MQGSCIWQVRAIKRGWVLGPPIGPEGRKGATYAFQGVKVSPADRDFSTLFIHFIQSNGKERRPTGWAAGWLLVRGWLKYSNFVIEINLQTITAKKGRLVREGGSRLFWFRLSVWIYWKSLDLPLEGDASGVVKTPIA